MQTTIQGKRFESLVRLDEELDSAIFLMDELSKYDSQSPQDEKSALEEYGMRLVSLRQKVRGFLESDPAKSQEMLEAYPDFRR